MRQNLKILLLGFGMILSDCIHGQAPIPSGLWTVDISHDDKYTAAGGDDSLLQVFDRDLSHYTSVKLTQQGMIRAVSWHPKEHVLAISTRNAIWIWNPETNQETKLEGAHSGSRSVGWNHTGELLAAAAGGGKIWIWNRKGQLLRIIQKNDETGRPDTRDFLGMDWHPSKNILTTVGDEIRVFDTSGKQLSVFKHRDQRAGILTVKWHPSGGFFATGDYGHEGEGIPTLLQFWKPDGTLIKEIKESKREFRNIRWSRNGEWLATASDAVRIWSKEGRLLHQNASGKTVFWGVDWTRDASKLVTVNYDTGKTELWTAEVKHLRSL